MKLDIKTQKPGEGSLMRLILQNPHRLGNSVLSTQCHQKAPEDFGR